MFRYPVEIIGDTYLSKLGGFSSILEYREVGINEKAIEMNTSLIPEVSEVKLKFLDSKDKPYFLKKSFKVVSIDVNSKESRLSCDGEIVLSEKHKENFRDYIGKYVILNSVESFRIDGDYSSMEKAVKSMREWIWKSESLQRRN